MESLRDPLPARPRSFAFTQPLIARSAPLVARPAASFPVADDPCLTGVIVGAAPLTTCASLVLCVPIPLRQRDAGTVRSAGQRVV